MRTFILRLLTAVIFATVVLLLISVLVNAAASSVIGAIILGTFLLTIYFIVRPE
jgi:hypothetical protein